MQDNPFLLLKRSRIILLQKDWLARLGKEAMKMAVIDIYWYVQISYLEKKWLKEDSDAMHLYSTSIIIGL